MFRVKDLGFVIRIASALVFGQTRRLTMPATRVRNLDWLKNKGWAVIVSAFVREGPVGKLGC